MVALLNSPQLIGEFKIASIRWYLFTIGRKSRGWYRIVLQYSVLSLGLSTESGRVASGGKTHGRHLHWSQTVEFPSVLHYFVDQPHIPVLCLACIWIDKSISCEFYVAVQNQMQVYISPSLDPRSGSYFSHVVRNTTRFCSLNCIPDSLVQGGAHEYHFLHYPSHQRLRFQSPQTDYLSHCSIICMHVGSNSRAEVERMRLPRMSNGPVPGGLATD